MLDATTIEHVKAAGTKKGPIVVKLGGAALDGAEHIDMATAVIASIVRGGAANLVVVHGGGSEVDRHLEHLGLVSEKRDGIRITPPEVIDEVVAVLAGKMNKRLVGALQAKGVRAVGIAIGDGELLQTRQATHYPFDPGRVGCIDGGDPAVVQALQSWGFLPVVCSIGFDGDGMALNVNADEAAAALAKLVGASSLMLLTDVPGVLDVTGQVLRRLTPEDVEVRIAANQIVGGMIPKVRGAVSIANELGIAVTIASWRDVPVAQQPIESVGVTIGTRIVPRGNATASDECVED